MNYLIVNNTKIELFEELKIDYERSNILNFNNNKVLKSASIKLLFTEKVKKVFANYIYTEKKENSDLIEAILDLNNYSIIGYVKVISKNKQGLANYLLLQFISKLGGIFESFKTLTLNKIDIDKYKNTQITTAFLKQIYESTQLEDIIFDYCCRGAKQDVVVFEWRISELLPAFRLQYIFSQIFAGYTIQSNLLEEFKDVYLIYTKNREDLNTSLFAEFNNVKLFIEYQQIVFQSTGQKLIRYKMLQDQLGNNGCWDFVNLKYVIQKAGAYKIQIKTNIAIQSLNAQLTFNIIIKKNQTTENVYFSTPLTNYFNNPYINEVVALNTDFIELTELDEIYFTVSGYAETNDVLTIFPGQGDYNYFKLTPLRFYTNNTVIQNFNVFLPSAVTIAEFLKNFLLLNNAVLYLNEKEKIVIIEKKKDFYSKTPIDISQNIDITSIKIYYADKTTYNFTFTEDTSDALLKDNIKNYDIKLGEGKKQDKKIDVFCPTFFERSGHFTGLLMPLLHKNKKINQQGEFIDDVYTTEFKKLRLLRLKSKTAGGFFINYDTITNIKEQEFVNKYPEFSNAVYLKEEDYKQSIEQLNNLSRLEVNAYLSLNLIYKILQSKEIPLFFIKTKYCEGVYECESINNISFKKTNNVTLKLYKLY